MNQSNAIVILKQLVNLGVREFCVCAGARNAPFVMALAHQTQIPVYNFLDERTAGFFALGRMRRTGGPVAVLTTSGTAVANLFPATIEAFYLGLPLVLLTADRPKSHRGKATPQAIEQNHLFGSYTPKHFDIEHSIPQITLSENAPTHVNVCFDEPLLDSPETVKDGSWAKLPALPVPKKLDALSKFPIQADKALVIVGPMSREHAEQVGPWISKWQAPVYYESLSNLGALKSTGVKLVAGHYFLGEDLEERRFKSVIRIGGVPVLRLWRDLETSDIPVYNFSPLPFSGLGRVNEKAFLLEDLQNVSSNWTTTELDGFRARDEERVGRLQRTRPLFLSSEPTLLSRIQEMWSFKFDTVFLGNSLPIREWDLWGPLDNARTEYFGQRGTNGIDGQIAHFLALAMKPGRHLMVLGDLSALYDLNALWALRHLPHESQVTIVVVNNGGGKIFKPMFAQALFENSHTLEFSGWAKMFGLPYSKVTNVRDLSNPPAGIVEIVPDNEQSTKFWRGIKTRVEE